MKYPKKGERRTKMGSFQLIMGCLGYSGLFLGLLGFAGRPCYVFWAAKNRIMYWSDGVSRQYVRSERSEFLIKCHWK